MAGGGVTLFTVGQVVEATGGRLVRGEAANPVARVVADSRGITPGDLFVAIPGARVDGHQFAARALAAGANCVLASRPLDLAPGLPGAVVEVADTVAALGSLAAYHRARFPVTVVGVTGSVGKTTTKDMIASVLARRYPVLKSPANLNTEIGLPLALLELAPQHRYAVLEMAMRGPGQIRHLARLARPGIGVITNVGETHLELLGSVENIARAKGELLEELPGNGTAVLNAGDANQRRWLAPLAPCPILWYGLDPAAAVTADGLVSRGMGGMAFRLLARGSVAADPAWREGAQVELPLPGSHHVEDALAAAAVGLLAGLAPGEVAEGLAGLELTAMRSQVIRAGAVTIINDAYNASPASTRAALMALAGARDGRRVAVLGDMLELGARAEPGHRDVGREAAAAGLSLLLGVGSLARHIVEGAVEAGFPAGQALHCADNAGALRGLLPLLEPGDTVLVKGSRGMRMEELVAGLTAWAGATATATAKGAGSAREEER